MEYEDKLIGNINLVYADNKVKLLKRTINSDDIEIINSTSDKFRDVLKRELLIQFRDSISCNDEYKIRRINKLVSNIDEVIDILLSRAAINMAEKTNLFRDYESNDDLRAKRIGKVAFRTELKFPTMEDIDSEMKIIHDIEKSYACDRVSNSFYNEALARCQQRMDLMYCARGELGDQFDSCYVVKLSSDIEDDYEIKKYASKRLSKGKGKSLKKGYFRKFNIFRK